MDMYIYIYIYKSILYYLSIYLGRVERADGDGGVFVDFADEDYCCDLQCNYMCIYIYIYIYIYMYVCNNSGIA